MEKQLAKLALELQKSQKVLEHGKIAHIQESHQLQIETGDCTGSLKPSPSHTPIGGNKSADQLTKDILVKSGSTKLDKTKGTQQAKTIDTEVKTKEQGTIKATKQVLEPPKSTTDITSTYLDKGKGKVEEDIPKTSQNVSEQRKDQSTKQGLPQWIQHNLVKAQKIQKQMWIPKQNIPQSLETT